MVKGQIGLFVIIAILIIGAVSLVIYYKSETEKREAFSEEKTLRAVSEKLRPVEESFLNCLKEKARDALDIIGQQAGYIELPAGEIASSYMPFSDKLNFLGTKVPYWWYISENNIVQEKVPKISDIEKEIEDYININSADCDLSNFFTEGFIINAEKNTTTDVIIKDDEVNFEVIKRISISYGNTTGIIEKHRFSLPIKLGRIYKNALAVYDAEQKSLFLENYSVDVIALYAPLSGFYLSCAPKMWNKADVEKNIKEALEGNIGALKLKGGYYRLAKPENKYFIQNINAEKGINVNFFYSKEWPTKIEIEPSKEGIMVAEPIGMQEGIGALGFCFISYHFVYDLAYPVMVQFYDVNENYLFQFPIIVSVFRNKPREAELSFSLSSEREICKRKIQQETVNVQDIYGKPVEAKISFKCLDTVCEIGKAELSDKGALLIEKFPQCINGFIIAEAEGYARAKQQVSTNKEGVFTIIMQPLHELKVDIQAEGVESIKNSKVVLVASKQDYMTTLIWPEQNKIKLAEGNYTMKAWMLKNGTFKLSEQTTEKCIKVPVGGIAGIFGARKEECFDLNVPEIALNELPVGGAFFNYSVSEEELSRANEITFYVNSWTVPQTQEQFIEIYNLIENEAVKTPALK
ncbi:MAG: hypothetical protein QW041_01490 [Candidatus Pacearchaeota archaeon]